MYLDVIVLLVWVAVLLGSFSLLNQFSGAIGSKAPIVAWYAAFAVIGYGVITGALYEVRGAQPPKLVSYLQVVILLISLVLTWQLVQKQTSAPEVRSVKSRSKKQRK